MVCSQVVVGVPREHVYPKVEDQEYDRVPHNQIPKAVQHLDPEMREGGRVWHEIGKELPSWDMGFSRQRQFNQLVVQKSMLNI